MTMQQRKRTTLSPFAGTVSVSHDETLLARSSRAMLLEEEGYEPVFYVPRQDVRLAHMTRSDTITTSPFKGVACYYCLRTQDGRLIGDVAWSYENPYPSVGCIAAHLAFDPRKVRVEASPLR
ncbi:DUF427 domain-containing protein [Afifella pfennigii]|uniref:DUF427 domain-containing protein n=1 Tax=Afifella pfennigii TaxID=209897 RepID=UPI00047DE10B|nr:DUF427 domain-containing protein [Afifella pfennigii]